MKISDALLFFPVARLSLFLNKAEKIAVRNNRCFLSREREKRDDFCKTTSEPRRNPFRDVFLQCCAKTFVWCLLHKTIFWHVVFASEFGKNFAGKICCQKPNCLHGGFGFFARFEINMHAVVQKRTNCMVNFFTCNLEMFQVEAATFSLVLEKEVVKGASLS